MLGAVGQAVTIGDTVLGVAFTDTPRQINNRTSRRGRLLAVGLVVGNRGETPFNLNGTSVALANGEDSRYYQPVMAAWGTPDDLDAGRYHDHYVLNPRETVAGLIVFDVPNSVDHPRLLVRDYNAANKTFSGAIDLTHTEKGDADGRTWKIGVCQAGVGSQPHEGAHGVVMPRALRVR